MASLKFKKGVDISLGIWYYIVTERKGVEQYEVKEGAEAHLPHEHVVHALCLGREHSGVQGDP